MTSPAPPPARAALPPLVPPQTGVTVRMYRQGHGDCFLLASRKADGTPFYMVIDCGLWTGSECDPKVGMEEVVASIAASTAGKVDVLVITHEHMDHVSGFAASRGAAGSACYWDAIAVDELWLAWTEDPKDPDANALRKRFDDMLLGLAAVADTPEAFGLSGAGAQAEMIRELLTLHTGETHFAGLAALAAGRGGFLGAAGGPGTIPGLSNKVAIKRMRDKARKVRFLGPGDGPFAPTGMGDGMRVYALGPPRDPALLLSLDPKGPEEFKFGLDGPARLLLSALASTDADLRSGNPFSPRYGVPPARLTGSDAAFFETLYGWRSDTPGTPTDPPHPEAWRAIDDDWTDAAESLALRLNDEVNNTSLVLALELPRTGKVLLFTGDAQRGSWISWSPLTWGKGADRVTARDLLARTVLYKVGHHGSHNATLHGTPGDPFPNLAWLAQGDYADEFVALIPANKKWAEAKRPKPWKHPLAAIERALVEKASGRVLRMDNVQLPEGPDGDEAWDRFVNRSEVNACYAQCTVED